MLCAVCKVSGASRPAGSLLWKDGFIMLRQSECWRVSCSGSHGACVTAKLEARNNFNLLPICERTRDHRDRVPRISATTILVGPPSEAAQQAAGVVSRHHLAVTSECTQERAALFAAVCQTPTFSGARVATKYLSRPIKEEEPSGLCKTSGPLRERERI